MNTTQPPCPEPSRLAAWIDGQASEAERAALLAHALDCPTCSELVADVLAAERAVHGRLAPRRPSWASPRWVAAAAALLVVAVGGFAFWLRTDAGAESYRRALVAALEPSLGSDVALAFHPPSGVSTSDLPVPRTLRGGSAPPPCGPGTVCGHELDAARRKAGSPLRLKFDREAAQIYLAASALNPDTAWEASDTIRENGWTRSADASLRVAACLVLAIAGSEREEDVVATLREIDPGRLQDPPTLYNLARLASLAGDSLRECPAWRAYLARAPSGPWRAEAELRSQHCEAR